MEQFAYSNRFTQFAIILGLDELDQILCSVRATATILCQRNLSLETISKTVELAVVLINLAVISLKTVGRVIPNWISAYSEQLTFLATLLLPQSVR